MTRQTLYRQFDKDRNLLYTGVSCQIRSRLRDHEKHSEWWSEVSHITIEHFPDRKSVLEAERKAIETENPKHNVQYNRNKRIQIEKPFTALDVTTAIDTTKDHITARLVSIPILSTPEKISDLLGLPRKVIRNAIETGALGYFEVPNSTLTKMIKVSSGWQILDWLESLGAANSGASKRK